MYYVLNFKTHSFTSCDTAGDVLKAIEHEVEQVDTDICMIEVVNCFPDDSRVSATEFMTANPPEYRIYNIEWDTDGEKVNLPSEVIACIPDDIEFADYLSDTYGFCVKALSVVKVKK